jgi:hypothetical protein
MSLIENELGADAVPSDLSEVDAPEWCFGYGELEWREGKEFFKVKDDAAIGDEPMRDCQTGEEV